MLELAVSHWSSNFTSEYMLKLAVGHWSSNFTSTVYVGTSG